MLRTRLESWTALTLVIAAAVSWTPCSIAQTQSDLNVGRVRVDATPGHIINLFDPDSALGSSIDVLSRLDINRVFTPHIIQESLSAGWGPITYRNNTELRM